MPWTLFVPSALLFYYPWRERLRDPATLVLTCWFVCTFVFFSISKSKIAYYLMPLLPSLALLVGCYLDRWLANEHLLGAHSKVSAVMLCLLAAVFTIAGIAVPLISSKIEPGIFSWALWAGIILLCGGVAAISLLLFKDAARAFTTVAGALCATLVLAGLGVLPYMNRYKSPRAMAQAIQAHVSQNGRLFVFRSTMNDFNYYAKREVITVADSQNDLDAAVGQNGETYLLIAEKDLNYIETKRLGLRVLEKSVGDRKWLLVRYPAPS